MEGVKKSVERVMTAILAPVTAPVAALAHCQGGSDVRLNAAWAGWHTALCLLTRRHILGRGLHSFTLELNLSNSRTHS